MSSPGKALLALLGACLPLLAGVPAFGQDLDKIEEQFVTLVEKVRPSVVTITSRFALAPEDGAGAKAAPDGTPASEPGKEKDRDKEEVEATFRTTFSGVIVDPEGIIVTVAGAVEGARSVEVQLLDETRYPATVLGFDRRSNLGVLRISAKGLRAVEFAPAGATKVGSWVVAVGNPFGLDHSVSHGLVSGLERNIGSGARTYAGMIQTTAPINPGDAGGLIANLRGQCVGVISSTYQRAASFSNLDRIMQELSREWDLPRMMREMIEGAKGENPANPDEMVRRMWQKMRERRHGTHEGSGGMPAGAAGMGGPMLGAEGINFVTPAETVSRVVKQIVATGKVRRARLGVRAQPLDAALRAQLGLSRGQGVMVADLEPGAPAEAAGLAPWDVILVFNGRAISWLSDLERAVADVAPETEVSVTLLRKGERIEVKVKLDIRPEDGR